LVLLGFHVLVSLSGSFSSILPLPPGAKKETHPIGQYQLPEKKKHAILAITNVLGS
jgi:hypothetical protein